MDDHLEAGDVVAILDVLGQPEKADELGRHHVARRDLVLVDGSQGLLGVELSEDGQCLTDVQRPQVEALTPAVVHPGRGEMHALERRELEGTAEELGGVSRHGGVDPMRRTGPHDGFGLPGRTRGIRNGQTELTVGRFGAGLALYERVDGHPARDVAANGDPQLDRSPARQCAPRARQVGVQDDACRVRVVDDPLDLRPGERRVERDRLVAALLRCQLPHDDVDVVGQRVGEDVTGDEPLGPQAVHHLVGAPGQLGECQRDARWGGDDSRLIRMFVGKMPHTERPVPGVLHGE